MSDNPTKPADSDQIAKARRFWSEWCGTNGIEAAEGWLELTPEQARKFAIAFAESERQAVKEECCRAVCVYCAGEDLFGLEVQPATINGGNTSGRWVHLTSREDIKAACDAAAIRSME